ncbi:MAG: hypothetical protein HQL50_06050 [Magnetococcales bacterium]|nr:hypothetical protein [Magnetococcales bacterium]
MPSQVGSLPPAELREVNDANLCYSFSMENYRTHGILMEVFRRYQNNPNLCKDYYYPVQSRSTLYDHNELVKVEYEAFLNSMKR